MKPVYAVACLAALTLSPLPASAAIQYMDQYRSQSLTQTADGNALSLNGWFFSTRLYASSANAFSSVTLTTPNSQVLPLTNSASAPATYAYQTALLPSQSAMDAQFPAGTYTYNADALTATTAYSTDSYPTSLPYLTGTDYSSLQGMNPSQPFTFHFSPFTGTANPAYLFFTILDTTTNTLVLDTGALSPGTSQYTLPANTLTSNDQYTYEIVFSNRVLVPSTNTTFDSQLGFDYRTLGTFTAGPVPEPASLLLLATPAALLLASRRKRPTPQ